MNKAELDSKIDELTAAANALEGLEKTFKLDDINALKIAIEAKALDDVVNILNTISLSSIQEMDAAIADANTAIKTQEARVAAFDKAYGILKTAFNIVV